MVDVQIIPRVSCDNCGTQAEKEVADRVAGKWRRPHTWGELKVSPTNYGNAYPNEIRMADLCPGCLRTVHEAVGEALRVSRKEEKDGILR